MIKYLLIVFLLGMTWQAVADDNRIRLNQSGNSDIYAITQIGNSNTLGGVTQTVSELTPTAIANISGGNNQITVRQGDSQTHIGNNQIDLAVSGSGNILNLNQGMDQNGYSNGLDQGGHHQIDYVNGMGNTITVIQQNEALNAGMFSSLQVIGNLNTVGITQTGVAMHQLIASVTGDQTTLISNQSGTSPHTINVTSSGNGNSAQITQNNNGSVGSNTASITLNNYGAPASVNLTQTGGQNYSITQSCATTCGVVTVKQGM